jgi:predicted RNA-binding protein with PUA-like domain
MVQPCASGERPIKPATRAQTRAKADLKPIFITSTPCPLFLVVRLSELTLLKHYVQWPSPSVNSDGMTQTSAARRYWLMKSEPEECSIDDALKAPGATVAWTGVRNYQARNFMRDAMQAGDGVFFYHSSCATPGIAGLAEVASDIRPDPTQFDVQSPYYDPKSQADKPRWLLRDVKALKKTRLISLPELRATPELADMVVLQRGSRLSITPVSEAHWRFILRTLLDEPLPH